MKYFFVPPFRCAPGKLLVWDSFSATFDLVLCPLSMAFSFRLCLRKIVSLGQFLSNNGLGELTFNLVRFDDIFRFWPLMFFLFLPSSLCSLEQFLSNNGLSELPGQQLLLRDTFSHLRFLIKPVFNVVFDIAASSMTTWITSST